MEETGRRSYTRGSSRVEGNICSRSGETEGRNDDGGKKLYRVINLMIVTTEKSRCIHYFSFYLSRYCTFRTVRARRKQRPNAIFKSSDFKCGGGPRGDLVGRLMACAKPFGRRANETENK